MCVCVCVCVCDSERERGERESCVSFGLSSISVCNSVCLHLAVFCSQNPPNKQTKRRAYGQMINFLPYLQDFFAVIFLA